MSRSDQIRPAHRPRLVSRRGVLVLVGGFTLGGGAIVADALTGWRVRSVAQSALLPGPARPKITECAGWQAREPSSSVTVVDRRPVRILVHHTATTNRSAVSADDLDVLARAIQDYHMNTNGWIDSGHHFLVNRGGLIAEGRHRSLETLLAGKQLIEGAHCPDQNDVAVGIENEGTYSEADPPTVQFATLRALCAFACLQYGIDPAELYGHRDFRDTACPGDRLYAMLPTLRTQVAGLLGLGKDGHSASAATWPLLRIADRGPVVLAAQHLLRAAGVPRVPADGAFGRSTADGVFEFQRRHGLESTGMIGGGSWPLLAVPVRAGQRGEAASAVQVLIARRPAKVPTTVRAATWQRLLGTG